MDLTDNQIEGTKLEIVSDDYDAYPLIYHIRDGNKILCKVESADPESTYDSFDAVEPYYRQEMEEYTFNNRSKKQGKKQKKAKVILNISNSNSDSESEIEIDEVQRGAGGSGGSRESRESIESNDPNETSKTNPKLKSNPNPDKDEDPQMKAAIEREQYYALEKYYGNMQKDLFEEIKNRIKIEKKAEGDSDNESGSKNSRKIKKSKSKDKEAEKQKQMRQPEKPQTDQIGPSSKKTQQNVRRRRR